MKKQEFPTFLNEQPSVVFGRNMRELMVILVGLGLSFVAWVNLGALVPGSGVGIIVLKGLCVLIILIATLIVAFIKIASQPLEEWALIGIFYFFTPKVFIYMPFDNDDGSNEREVEMLQNQLDREHVGTDDGFN